jgi:hypothetical protein
MANNVTVVDNGVVQQRFYQVYGDLIESKETMEPIAIAHGNGPICGFDIVDTSTDHVVIRGSWDPSLSSAGISAPTILKKANRRIILSDGENNSGTVVNATITNDGLIHICPTILDFTDVKPTGGWFDLSNPSKFVAFAMKVSHSYTPVSDASNLGVGDFSITWLTLEKSTGGTYSPAEVASLDFSSLVGTILPTGWINRDTDALVGIYIIGYDPSWGDNDVYASFGYKMALVSYDGKWPVSPFTNGSFDILSLNQKVKNIPVIEDDIDSLKGLNSILQNQVNTLGKGIECDYTLDINVTDEGTGDGTVSITIKKLVYLGVSLYEGAGKTFTSNTLYLSNIRAIYLDILSSGTNQDTGLPSISKWGLSLGSSAVRLTNPRDIKGSLSGDFQGTGESGSTTAGIICLINKDGSQTPDSLYDQVGNGKSSKVVKPSDDPSYYLALVLNNFFNRFANTGDKLDTSSKRDKRYTRIFIDTKSGGLTSSDTCGITFRLYPTGINLSWYIYLSNTSSPYTQGTFRLDLNSELALHFKSYVLKNVYDFYKKVTAQEHGGKLLLQSIPLMVNTTQTGLASEVNGHIFVYLIDDSSGNFYLEVVVGTITGSSSTIQSTYFGTTFIPFMLNDVWDLCNTGDVSITPHV